MRFIYVNLLAEFLLLASAQQISRDPGLYGPTLELVHLYNDEFPTGIAVSSTGRKFSNYPPALDPMNTRYTVAELNSNNTETLYPSAEINSPPGRSINYTTVPPSGANYPNYLISVQSVVIDPKDRLWILDTGRASTSNGMMVPSSPGGPKLVGVNLTDNSIFTTIPFPPTVAYPDSYLNDIRFDLRPHLTPSGLSIAYISDSSTEGRNGIITIDLGAVRPQQQPVPYVSGEAVYSIPGPGLPTSYISFGADGIALSADGKPSTGARSARGTCRGSPRPGYAIGRRSRRYWRRARL
ncbi:hypothetical protein MMC30_003395 [Trapelia coarctata]|nr:hypothetical protein [Trapelia coarctata]